MSASGSAPDQDNNAQGNSAANSGAANSGAKKKQPKKQPKKPKTLHEAASETRDLVNDIANLLGTVPRDLPKFIQFEAPDSPFDKELKAFKAELAKKGWDKIPVPGYKPPASAGSPPPPVPKNLQEVAIDFCENRLKNIFVEIHEKALQGEPFDPAAWKAKVEAAVEQELRGYIENQRMLSEPSKALAENQEVFLNDLSALSRQHQVDGKPLFQVTSDLYDLKAKRIAAGTELKEAKKLRNDNLEEQKDLETLLQNTKDLAESEMRYRARPLGTPEAYEQRILQYGNPTYYIEEEAQLEKEITTKEKEMRDFLPVTLGGEYKTVEDAMNAYSTLKSKIDEAEEKKKALDAEVKELEAESKAGSSNPRLPVAQKEQKSHADEIARWKTEFDPLDVAFRRFDTVDNELQTLRKTKREMWDNLQDIIDAQETMQTLSKPKATPLEIKEAEQTKKEVSQCLQLTQAPSFLSEAKSHADFARNIAPVAEKVLRNEFLRARVPNVTPSSTLQQQATEVMKAIVPDIIEELKKNSDSTVQTQVADIESRNNHVAYGGKEKDDDSPEKRFEELMRLVNYSQALDSHDRLRHLANCARLAHDIHKKTTAALPADPEESRKQFASQLKQLETLSQQQLERQTKKRLPEILKVAADDMQELSRQLAGVQDLPAFDTSANRRIQNAQIHSGIPDFKDGREHATFVLNDIVPVAERVLRYEFRRANVPGVLEGSNLEVQVTMAVRKATPDVITELDKAIGRLQGDPQHATLDRELKRIQAVGAPESEFQNLMLLVDQTQALNDNDELNHLAGCARLAQNIHKESTAAAPPTDPEKNRKLLAGQLEQLQTLSQEQFERQKNWYLAQKEKEVEAKLTGVKDSQESQVTGQQKLQATLEAQAKTVKAALEVKITDDAQAKALFQKLNDLADNPPADLMERNRKQGELLSEIEGLKNPLDQALLKSVHVINVHLMETRTASQTLKEADDNSKKMLKEMQDKATHMLDKTAAEHFAFMTKHLHRQKGGLRTAQTRRQWGWDQNAHQYYCDQHRQGGPGNLSTGREEYGLAGGMGQAVRYQPGLIYNTHDGFHRIHFTEETDKDTGDKIMIAKMQKATTFWEALKTNKWDTYVFSPLSPSTGYYNAFLSFDKTKFKLNKGAELAFLMSGGATKVSVIPPASAMKAFSTARDHQLDMRGDLFHQMDATIDLMAAKQLNIFHADHLPSPLDLKDHFKNSYLITGSKGSFELHYIDEKGVAHTSTKYDAAALEQHFRESDVLKYNLSGHNMNHLASSVDPAMQQSAKVRRLNLEVKQLERITGLFESDPAMPREKGTNRMIWQGGLNFGSLQDIENMRLQIHNMVGQGLLKLEKADELIRKLDIFARHAGQSKKLVQTAEEKQQQPLQQEEKRVTGRLVGVDSLPLSTTPPSASPTPPSTTPPAPASPVVGTMSNDAPPIEAKSSIPQQILSTATAPSGSSLDEKKPSFDLPETTGRTKVVKEPMSDHPAIPPQQFQSAFSNVINSEYKTGQGNNYDPSKDDWLKGELAKLCRLDTSCHEAFKKASSKENTSADAVKNAFNEGVKVLESVKDLYEQYNRTHSAGPAMQDDSVAVCRADLIEATTLFLSDLTQKIEVLKLSGTSEESLREASKPLVKLATHFSQEVMETTLSFGNSHGIEKAKSLVNELDKMKPVLGSEEEKVVRRSFK